MRQTIKQISLIALVLLTLSCGGGSDEGGSGGGGGTSPTVAAPQMLSVTPANGAKDIPKGDVEITLTFDQNINFISANTSQINISGGTISSAQAYLKTLTIKANCPDDGATVAIMIPKGLVKNSQQMEAEAISFSFTIKARYTPDKSAIKTKPLTQNAAAVKLYEYFLEQYGQKVISSVMANVNWNNECAEKVYQLTGKYPAMNCYDFIHIHYSPANWIDYTKIDPVKTWVDTGGIVQLMWHFNVPKDEAGASGTSDWNARPENTTFKGSNALKEGTWENKVFYEQMDKVVATILKLKEAGIAATWRPFHEAAGNSMAKTYAGKAWFWWGDEGAEVFKKLWIAMYEYFAQKGVDNLIWIWTTQNYGNDPSSYDQDTAWYPGDQYVDMVARDLYGRSATEKEEEFRQIQETYPHMMVALGECGYNTNTKADPAKIGDCWGAGALWSHFMVWYQGDYGSTGTMASDNWWKDAMKADCVITRDQLPSMK